MNPSLQEIENSLFDKLKSLNCIPIKNIIAIEPNVTLKNILLDQSYTQEKLNIFIWVIFKVEPKFSPEFIDSEYFAPEVKSKKIIECLTNLGIVEPNDFNKDKLFNTTQKHYRELLLILDDVSQLLPSKTNNPSSNLEDFLSFDLSITASFCSNFGPAKNDTNFDEVFAKKIQIFDDQNYLNEYRTIIQPGTASSLIPSDLIRVIKNINANSTYFENIQFGKGAKKDEILTNLEVCLEELKQQIEHNRNILLTSNSNDVNLLQINEDSIELDEFNIKLERYLEEIQSYLNGFKEMTKEALKSDKLSENSNSFSDLNEFKRESSLGANYQVFYDLMANYQKLTKYFKNWSIFVNRQNEKQGDYEANSVLLKNNNLHTFLNENEVFIKQIEECINCLGNKIFA